jgi:hypothetical protein
MSEGRAVVMLRRAPGGWVDLLFVRSRSEGGSGFGGVDFFAQLWGGYDVGSWRVDGFLDLDAEDVAGAEHVAGEDDHAFVGGEADVGFEAVVVVGHVDEVLGVEDAGLPEGG